MAHKGQAIDVSYRVEVWNDTIKSYIIAWRGRSLEQGQRSFAKPYYKAPKRLVSITVTKTILEAKVRDPKRPSQKATKTHPKRQTAYNPGGL